MVDLTRTYHHGIRVPNLDEAMAELGNGLGATWCSVQESNQTVWLPDVGMTTIPLRFTYSTEGPLHLELLEGAAGSIWDGRAHPGLHHVGVWSDDIAADTRALLASGWKLLMAQNEPDKNFGVFTYLQPPSGLIVELVWSAIRPIFENWFAGGDLG
jgi:hypothetical protein